jgi:hypothetical protein
MLPTRGSPSLHWNRDIGPTMLLRSNNTGDPSGFFSIHPMLASSLEFTNKYPKPASAAAPPQFTPPIAPGKIIVE